MTKKNTTKSALLMSALSLMLCFTMLLGTTFAWFTDSAASGSNVIKSGNLDIEVQYTLDGKEWKELDGADDLFQKGLWEPGHTEVVALRITNKGSLALKYAANMNIVSETAGKTKDGADIVLSDILTVSTLVQQAIDDDGNANQVGDITLSLAFNGENSVGYENTTTFKDGNVLRNDVELHPGAAHYLIVRVDMAETVGNEANHKGSGFEPSIDFGINILATQFAYESDSFGSDYDKDAAYEESAADLWDGTADTSWYNDTDTEFTLSTAEELAGLALLTGTTDQFAGKTIILDSNINLALEEGAKSAFEYSFAPIGSTGERDDRNRLVTKSFKGTFDGNGHTVSNLYQSGWDFGYEWGQYGSLGLFSQLEGATVKNVVLDGFDAQVEGGDISFIAGSATGDCVFENIEIKNSSIGTYNNGIGSIIGWSGAGTYTFKDITIAEDVVLGGLWGSFDSSVGGIVGQAESGATYNFENVEINCRLDVYNDCTASYDYYLYRMCGMIIGRCAETTTIDGKNYPDMTKYNITCTNVTVNYGDWMNYHYCEPTPGHNNGRGMRVEPGYAYGGLPADFDHTQCTINHNTCIPFDGLFGGDQIGVNTIKTYPGVTVNYPASYTPKP